MRPNLAVSVVVLCAGGMFFLKLPLFVVAGVALTTISFLIILSRRLKIDTIGAVVLLNYFYWIASGLLVGAISLGDFAVPGFYEGDGRIFLYYLPLLLFSVYAARLSALQRSVQVLLGLGIVLTILYLIWASAHPAWLSKGREGVFVALLTSHTGAGTFFGLIATFLTLYGLKANSRPVMVAGLLVILSVLASASREALVALLAVMIWFLARNLSFKVLLRSSILAGVAIGVMYMAVPHSFNRTRAAFSPEALRAMQDVYALANWETGQARSFEEGDFNILSRMLFWAYAMKLFGDSPVLGIGFARYNDPEKQLTGFSGIAAFATTAQKEISVHTAHNSYLHVLAESGLVGLILLLLLWGMVYHRCRNAEAHFDGEPALAAYYVACQGLVVYVAIAALFGHGLGSPALGIPLLAIVGVGLSAERTARRAGLLEGLRAPTPVRRSSAEDMTNGGGRLLGPAT